MIPNKVWFRLSDLTVQIQGTGAIGLAYGYFLSGRGINVRHTSLRGNHLSTFKVRHQSSSGTSQTIYTPNYGVTEVKTDLRILALSNERLHSELIAKPVSSVPTLVFCSNPKPVEGLWAKLRGTNCALVYPIISAEFVTQNHLQIVTDGNVEFAVSRDMSLGERLVLETLIAQTGLKITNLVPPEHFQARYFQTAAFYIVLLALGSNTIKRFDITSSLLVDIFHDFLAMHNHMQNKDLPDITKGRKASIEMLASIVASEEAPAADNVVAQNLEYLIHHGRHKLVSHLTAIVAPWNTYHATLETISTTSTQKLIYSTLSSF
jgi:hypothetical protein